MTSYLYYAAEFCKLVCPTCGGWPMSDFCVLSFALCFVFHAREPRSLEYFAEGAVPEIQYLPFNITSANFTNLDHTKNYTFRVFVQNDAGWSLSANVTQQVHKSCPPCSAMHDQAHAVLDALTNVVID